ncbi:MAG: hypothetical protein ACFB10_22055 [Salibacteraceae bacterium]
MKRNAALTILLPAFALLTVLTFSSCEKYRLNRETNASEDNNLAENFFNDVHKVAEEAAKGEELDEEGKTEMVYSFGSCATVTVNPAWPDPSFPKTIDVDFGTSPCTGTDGRTRTGKLVYTLTDYYRNDGSVMTITTENYTVNDYQVDGTRKVTNNGRNGNNNLNFSIEVSGARITTPEGEVVTWNSTRNREWIEGENTNFLTDGITGILDDVYLITGSGSGTSRAGRDFEVEITEALRVELDCRWITAGEMEIRPNDLKTRTIDYGDGDCDQNATVSIGNRDYDILLR